MKFGPFDDGNDGKFASVVLVVISKILSISDKYFNGPMRFDGV